jgi:hypothetical protein
METHDTDSAPAEHPPHYRGADQGGTEPAAGSSPAAMSRTRVTVIAVIVVALLAVMIVLHVTGVVGAGTNG